MEEEEPACVVEEEADFCRGGRTQTKGTISWLMPQKRAKIPYF